MHIDTDKALAWLDQLREGVENSNNAAEIVVTRAMAAGEVFEALEDLIWLHKRDAEDYNDVFERIGERFYKECGMLRPGKSQPDEMMGTPSDEERKETFDAWIACFRTRAVNALDIAGGSHD